MNFPCPFCRSKPPWSPSGRPDGPWDPPPSTVQAFLGSEPLVRLNRKSSTHDKLVRKIALWTKNGGLWMIDSKWNSWKESNMNWINMLFDHKIKNFLYMSQHAPTIRQNKNHCLSPAPGHTIRRQPVLPKVSWWTFSNLGTGAGAFFHPFEVFQGRDLTWWYHLDRFSRSGGEDYQTA